jgi:hypothetical protein
MPLALALDSDLMGYLTVVTLFGAIGFGVWAEPLCFYIGFNSENAMHRTTVGAVALLSGFFGAQMMGVDPALLRPFSSSVSVFGTVVLFIAMLIMSSK